jgi:hypothetical protein
MRQPAVGVVGRTLSIMCWKRACKRVCETTGGLRPPLLCCGAHVCRRKNAFCDAHTHVRSRAPFVSPPWSGSRTGNGERVLPNINARIPRGAYAPRSCVAVRTYADEITIFAMHIRTFTRAAGVSPPWFANAGAIADIFHGRLTPTALGARRSSAEQGAIGSAQTHAPKSGGRQSAVVRWM